MKKNKQQFNRGEIAYNELKAAGIKLSVIARELKISIQLLRWQLLHNPNAEVMQQISKALARYRLKIESLSRKFKERFDQ